MDEVSLTSLIVKKGQRLTPTLWMQLLRWVERNMVVRGDVLSTQTASGRMISGKGGDGESTVSHPWQMDVGTDTDGSTIVQFNAGTVNGVEPQLDGRDISEGDDNGDTPALTIADADFGPDRLCRIYVKAVLEQTSYTVQSATAWSPRQRTRSRKRMRVTSSSAF